MPSGKFNNILETIGRTPVVKLNKLAPEGINLYVKIESFNPMGSVKDRLALSVIEQAEQSGELKPGQTVIEATSGNTGIGLAMVCAQKDYPLVVTMAESFSIERRKMMCFLGVKVVLTPAALKAAACWKRRWSLRQNTAGSTRGNSKMRPMPMLTLAPPRQRYWPTSMASGSTIG